MTFWVAELGDVLNALVAAGAQAGVRSAVTGPAGAGLVYACLDPDCGLDPAADHDAAAARFVTALRERLAPRRAGRVRAPHLGRAGQVTVLAAPAPVRAAVGGVRRRCPAPALMRAVKDQFDPEHRMFPGRFLGGSDAGREHAAGGGQGLRALRVLPAGLPHLPAVGRGDGLAAGPDLPGEPDPGRRGADPGGGRALRPLPGLHGVHDGLPVRRAVRPAHRGGPGLDRGRPAELAAWRPDGTNGLRDRAAREAIFALFPYPRGCGR